MEAKKCADCQEIKSVEDFGVDSGRLSGLNPYCKSCCSRRRKRPALFIGPPRPFKVCGKCSVEKQITEFCFSKTNCDQHSTYCRACSAVHNKLYKESAELQTLRAKEWYWDNLDRARACGRARSLKCYYAHREEQIAKMRSDRIDLKDRYIKGALVQSARRLGGDLTSRDLDQSVVEDKRTLTQLLRLMRGRNGNAKDENHS